MKRISLALGSPSTWSTRIATLLAILTLVAAPFLFAKGGHSSHSKATGTTNPKVVHVKGYVKKNGTYVAPHDRTAPNATKNDNWSTKGNINPETGKLGTRPRDEDLQSATTSAHTTSTVATEAARTPAQTDVLGQTRTQSAPLPSFQHDSTSLFELYRTMAPDERKKFAALVLSYDSASGAEAGSHTSPISDPEHDPRCKSLGNVWGEYVSSTVLSEADRKRLFQEAVQAAQNEAATRGATHSIWRPGIATNQHIKATLSIWKCY